MAFDINKIKFDQKDIDKKLIRGSDRMKGIYNMARNMEYQQYFEPGQVLVLRNIKGDYKATAGSLVMNDAGAPQKYIVADKLDGNLVLCRKLGVNGRPGKGICVIADMDYDTYRFEEDPEIADSILLDFDYDPMYIPKLMGKARKHMKDYNKQIHISTVMKEKTGNSSYDKVIQFIQTLVDSGRSVIWGLERDTDRKMYHIVSVNPSEQTITLNTGERLRNYDLTRRYGQQFYLEEPLTRDEALLRIKSK